MGAWLVAEAGSRPCHLNKKISPCTGLKVGMPNITRMLVSACRQKNKGSCRQFFNSCQWYHSPSVSPVHVLEVLECLLVDRIDLLHLHALYANAFDQSCKHAYLVHERRDMLLVRNALFLFA